MPPVTAHWRRRTRHTRPTPRTAAQSATRPQDGPR